MNIKEIERISNSNEFWGLASGDHLNMIYALLEHIESVEAEIDKYKEALRDTHLALAMALLKNGGSMDFGYRDFFEKKKNESYEFSKHENYHDDIVTIKVRKVIAQSALKEE